MKYEVIRDVPPLAFAPINVTLVLDSQAKLNAFTALCHFSYTAGSAIEVRAARDVRDLAVGIDVETIDSLFPSSMLVDLEAQGGRSE